MAQERDERFHALVQRTLRDVGTKRSEFYGGAAAPVTQKTAPVVELVMYVLTQAVEKGASDIHLEPQEADVRIRVRIDGLLQERQEPLPKKVAAVFLSRVKVLAKMDVSNAREPQDGSFHFLFEKKQRVDVRAATLPTIEGEALVMRLLLHDARARRLGELGLCAEDEAQVRALFRRPSGITIFAGPMGAGKTTTLYAALAELMTAETSILTLDDPVEYVLPGALQVNVQAERAGQGESRFAAFLKHTLRMDAEILAIGETRDEETAEISLRAALTGHRVFTTLHAGDACAAVLRLLDMGLPPYLLAATLTGVVAQRLVRRICPACREMREATLEEGKALGIPPGAKLAHGRGCAVCHGTGYQGRMVLSEVLVLSEAMREAIAEGVHLPALRAMARQAGSKSLREDGKKKILSSMTTLEEVERVLHGG